MYARSYLTLIIIASVALTFIVLIQKPKGGGIASNFSGGSQIMGVKRTNEIVEKLTWGLAVALLFLNHVKQLVSYLAQAIAVVRNL